MSEWLIHWAKAVVCVLIPFSILLYFNVGIIVKLHRQRSMAMRQLMMQFAVDRDDVKQQDARIRQALQTLTAIVFAYLLSNLLNVLLIVLEGAYGDKWLDDNYPITYKIAIDLSSLLAVLGNVVRLPIYMCRFLEW